MTTIDEVLKALDRLSNNTVAIDGPLSLGQVLCHCAQSVEYSMNGFPKPASWIVRTLIGPYMKRRFLQKGAMRHNTRKPIPGAPALPPTPDADGIARLRAALVSFRAFTGSMAPHFAYGPATKAEYEALHAMHVANHLNPG